MGATRFTTDSPKQVCLTDRQVLPAHERGVQTPERAPGGVTPAHRGMGAPQSLPAAEVAKPSTLRHGAMSWARRLKRVFCIEIEDCARCGGKLQVIASIEEPQVIARILAHLEPSQARLL